MTFLVDESFFRFLLFGKGYLDLNFGGNIVELDTGELPLNSGIKERDIRAFGCTNKANHRLLQDYSLWFLGLSKLRVTPKSLSLLNTPIVQISIIKELLDRGGTKLEGLDVSLCRLTNTMMQSLFSYAESSNLCVLRFCGNSNLTTESLHAVKALQTTKPGLHVFFDEDGSGDKMT